MTQRMTNRFAKLAEDNRPAFVTYFMGGDPDFETSVEIMKGLPKAGADVIELGMPFSDPMADGPSIQAAGLRALKQGQNLQRTFDMVRAFREDDDETPIVLMGYYNPIYQYGSETFLDDAKEAGVDGMIIVDLPPEMDEELCIPALSRDLNFIRLATPTTDEKRLPKVLSNTSGFLYYVLQAQPHQNLMKLQNLSRISKRRLIFQFALVLVCAAPNRPPRLAVPQMVLLWGLRLFQRWQTA